MKLSTFFLALLAAINSYSQQVILFDNANFTGASKTLSPGNYQLTEFNDMASSVKVPAGMAVIISEHADDAGAYGKSVDLLEDCSDLSKYDFDNKASYMIVFNTSNDGLVWARGRMGNGAFIPGHWERRRANGVLPPNNGAVVSPYNLPRGSGMGSCNPKLCLDLLLKLEALNAGTNSSYYPTATEQKPIIDSLITAYENSPEGLATLEKYNKALKDYQAKYNWWSHLPPYKQEQVPEPTEPEKPIPANNPEHLRSKAVTILQARNHAREIETTQQKMLSCQCDVIGYGLPTPVFTDTAIVVNDIRNALPEFAYNTLYEKAINDQMGIIGSDFRPKRSIGSAAFEREFDRNSWGGFGLDLIGGSNLNFWYPQKRKGERSFYKQTLSGRVSYVGIANKEILVDRDVNIDIIPSANYSYLISEAHAPEVTSLTEIDLRKKGEVVQCPAKFIAVEAEIDIIASVREKFAAMAKTRKEKTMCVYGPWIYDKGHCDHPEIHPAEQIWWSSDAPDLGNDREYYCNVFCDASKRFWWRDQMDDGTKIKPWGAPPIEGTFAIAFETTLGRPAKTFEVVDIDAYNVANPPMRNKSYNLVYQGQTIVSFIPHNNAFKVSYENVGLVGNKVRGFLVISTTVGSVRQIATEAVIQPQDPSKPYNTKKTAPVPLGVDVNKIPQSWERQVFEKKEGHYMFKITRSYYKY